jgi:hypothetical protein
LKELAWLLPFDKRARAENSARRHESRGYSLGTRADRSSIWRVVIVPADGTSAATEGNGDFGTSPIFGQLSDKPALACIWVTGVPDVKRNSGSRN